jgi:hypothetical protein
MALTSTTVSSTVGDVRFPDPGDGMLDAARRAAERDPEHSRHLTTQ